MQTSCPWPWPWKLTKGDDVPLPHTNEVRFFFISSKPQENYCTDEAPACQLVFACFLFKLFFPPDLFVILSGHIPSSHLLWLKIIYIYCIYMYKTNGDVECVWHPKQSIVLTTNFVWSTFRWQIRKTRRCALHRQHISTVFVRLYQKWRQSWHVEYSFECQLVASFWA